jgi:quercetin dioxygenase-like cupin family protein
LKAFSHFEFGTGKIGDLDRKFPSYLSAWECHQLDVKDETSGHFGYVDQGVALLSYQGNFFALDPGMYFSVAGSFSIRGGRGIIMSRENHKPFFSIGGPAEREGRLKYIDGCTDSLLISPIKKGDPCLNLLYFPPNIDQTAHTHPSDRIGMIMSGRGKCVTPEGEIDLVAGMIFCIHTDGVHKFQTPYGEDMRVLAYHPDSDFGPEDQFHPMINRTLVDGVSASMIDSIRTK